MKEKITNYINEIASEKGVNVHSETDLYDSGILDSMEIILFLTFLDEEMDIKIDFTDLNFEHFKTIDSIISWLEKR